MNVAPARPLVGFNIVGRYDQYIGNFVERLQTSINYLIHSASKINQLHQFNYLIVDWNGEKPLQDALILSKEAEKVVKFIRVPPEIAQKYSFGDSGFNVSVSQNVGLRRLQTEYMISMPADIIMPPLVLEQLIKVLSKQIECYFNPEKSLMCVPRRFIPYQFDQFQDLQGIENYLAMNSSFLTFCNQHNGLASGAGGIMMHRNLWHQIHGLDESLGGWGFSDTEVGLRINQYYPSVDLNYYGVNFYDLDQSPSLSVKKLKRANPSKVNLGFVANDENWGLGHEDLPLTDYRYEQPQNRHIVNAKDKNFTPILQQLCSNSLLEFLCNLSKLNDYAIHDYYYPLAWFVNFRKCYKFLDYGFNLNSFSNLIVSKANPCAAINVISVLSEVQGISAQNMAAFDHGTKRLALLNSGEELHKGRIRLLEGFLDTALDRLKASHFGDFNFDLILFRADLINLKARAELNKILLFLNPQGCLIFVCKDSQLFSQCLDQVKITFPNLSLLSLQKIGIFLVINEKIILPDNGGAQLAELSNFWQPMQINPIVLRLRKSFTFLARVFEGLYFKPVHQWWRILLVQFKAQWRQSKTYVNVENRWR